MKKCNVIIYYEGSINVPVRAECTWEAMEKAEEALEKRFDIECPKLNLKIVQSEAEI